MATTQVLDLEFRTPTGRQVSEPFDAIVAGEGKARQAQAKSASATIQNLNRVGALTLSTSKKIDQLTKSAGLYDQKLRTSVASGKLLADTYKTTDIAAKKLTDTHKNLEAGFGRLAMLGFKLVKEAAEELFVELIGGEDALKKLLKKRQDYTEGSVKFITTLFAERSASKELNEQLERTNETYAKMDKNAQMLEAGFGGILKKIVKFYTAVADDLFEQILMEEKIIEELIRKQQDAADAGVKLASVFIAETEAASALEDQLELVNEKYVKMDKNAEMLQAGFSLMSILWRQLGLELRDLFSVLFTGKRSMEAVRQEYGKMAVYKAEITEVSGEEIATNEELEKTYVKMADSQKMLQAGFDPSNLIAFVTQGQEAKQTLTEMSSSTDEVVARLEEFDSMIHDLSAQAVTSGRHFDDIAASLTEIHKQLMDTHWGSSTEVMKAHTQVMKSLSGVMEELKMEFGENYDIIFDVDRITDFADKAEFEATRMKRFWSDLENELDDMELFEGPTEEADELIDTTKGLREEWIKIPDDAEMASAGFNLVGGAGKLLNDILWGVAWAADKVLNVMFKSGEPAKNYGRALGYASLGAVALTSDTEDLTETQQKADEQMVKMADNSELMAAGFNVSRFAGQYLYDMMSVLYAVTEGLLKVFFKAGDPIQNYGRALGYATFGAAGLKTANEALTDVQELSNQQMVKMSDNTEMMSAGFNVSRVAGQYLHDMMALLYAVTEGLLNVFFKAGDPIQNYGRALGYATFGAAGLKTANEALTDVQELSNQQMVKMADDTEMMSAGFTRMGALLFLLSRKFDDWIDKLLLSAKHSPLVENSLIKMNELIEKLGWGMLQLDKWATNLELFAVGGTGALLGLGAAALSSQENQEELTDETARYIKVGKDAEIAQAGFVATALKLATDTKLSADAQDEHTTAVEIAIPKVKEMTEQVEQADEAEKNWLETGWEFIKQLGGKDELLDESTKGMKHYREEAVETNKEMTNLNITIEDSKEKWTALDAIIWKTLNTLHDSPLGGSLGGSAIKGGFNWLIDSTRLMREGALEFNDLIAEAENLGTSFLESGYDIAKAIAEVSRQSDHTIAQTLENMRKTTFMVETLGLNLEETKTFLSEYQKMLFVYQRTSADTAQVTSILNKAFVANKLSAEDLAIVYENAPVLFEKMADAAAFAGLKLEKFTAYNETTLESFKKLAEEGKLTKEVFKNLVIEISKGSDDINQAFDDISTPGEVQADRLKVAWGEFTHEVSRLPLFLGKIARGLSLTTAGFKQTADIGTEFVEKASMGAEVIAKMVASVNKAFDDAATLYKQFLKDITGGWRVDEMDMVLNLLGLYPKKLDKAIERFDYLKESMAQAAQFQVKWNKALKEEKKITDELIKKQEELWEQRQKELDDTIKDFEKQLEIKEQDLKKTEIQLDLYEKYGILQENLANITDRHAKAQLEAATDMLVAAAMTEEAYNSMLVKTQQQAMEAHLEAQEELNKLTELQKEYNELQLRVQTEAVEARKFVLEKDLENQRAYVDMLQEKTNKQIAHAEKFIEQEEKLTDKLTATRGRAEEVFKKYKDVLAEVGIVEEEVAEKTDKATESVEKKIEKVEEAIVAEEGLVAVMGEVIRVTDESIDKTEDLADAAEDKAKTVEKAAKQEQVAIGKTNYKLKDQAEAYKGLSEDAKQMNLEQDSYWGAIIKNIEEGRSVIASYAEAHKIQAHFHGQLSKKMIGSGRIELKLMKQKTKEIKKQTSALKSQTSALKSQDKHKFKSVSASRFMPPPAAASYGFGVTAGISAHQESVMHDVARKIAEGMTQDNIINALGLKNHHARGMYRDWGGRDIYGGFGRLIQFMGKKGIELPSMNITVKKGEFGNPILSGLFGPSGTTAMGGLISSVNVAHNMVSTFYERGLVPRLRRAFPEMSAISVLDDGVLSQKEEEGLRSSIGSIIEEMIKEVPSPLRKALLSGKDAMVDTLFDRVLGFNRFREQYAVAAGKRKAFEKGQEFDPSWHVSGRDLGHSKEDMAEFLQGTFSNISDYDLRSKFRRKWDKDKLDAEKRREAREAAELDSLTSGIGGTGGAQDISEAQSRRISLLENEISIRDDFARSIARQITPIGQLPPPVGESIFADAPTVIPSGQPDVTPPPVVPPATPPPVEVSVAIDPDSVTQAGLASTDTDTENLFKNAIEQSGYTVVRYNLPSETIARRGSGHTGGDYNTRGPIHTSATTRG